MPVNFDPLLLSNKELTAVKDNFFKELQSAALGEKNSIPFLRHTLPSISPLKNDEVFQVMTIGGSVFKSALVKKTYASYEILNEIEDTLPRFESESIFLAYIDNHLDASITYLSLNLAYPLNPVFHDNLLDGILIRGTKEHLFSGLVGKEIGSTIEGYVKEKRKKTIRVTLANDTVCLFLSEITNSTWNSTISGIIGTGLNYAFGLKGEVINLECGHFSNFTQTDSGILVDKKSHNPGSQLIEKEIAGAYLFHHFNIIKKENSLDIPLISSTRELSALAEKNEGDESKLAQILLERSASFAACQIAGIVEFLSNLTNSTNLTNYTFVMEGSLFWEGANYQNYLNKYLNVFQVADIITFNQIRHHSIKGGIKLLTGLS